MEMNVEVTPTRSSDSQFAVATSDNKQLLKDAPKAVLENTDDALAEFNSLSGQDAAALQRKAEDDEDEVQAYVKKIKASLGNQRASIFHTADLLAAAKDNLDKQDFEKVCQEAGLKSTSNVDNYIRIAKAKHLRRSEFLPHLPLAVGTLIDLAKSDKWTAKKIKECIDAGVMRPDAIRKELNDWITANATRKELTDWFAAREHCGDAGISDQHGLSPLISSSKKCFDIKPANSKRSSCFHLQI